MFLGNLGVDLNHPPELCAGLLGWALPLAGVAVVRTESNDLMAWHIFSRLVCSAGAGYQFFCCEFGVHVSTLVSRGHVHVVQ